MTGEASSPAAAAPLTPPQPPAPRMIGQWEVEKQIGRGSFAVVWRARHAASRVKVAIKEIKLEKLNRKLRESLESEISVLQRSKHDNIIKLHEIIKVRPSPAKPPRTTSPRPHTSFKPKTKPPRDERGNNNVFYYLRR